MIEVTINIDILTHLKTPLIVSGRSSASDSTEGAHDAPPGSLVGWEGISPPRSSPLPSTCTASRLGAFGNSPFVESRNPSIILLWSHDFAL